MKEDYKEYNLLTKRLLEEGYSAEHHPDHVRVDVPMWQEKTLDNYDGGFTYERWWIFEQTFKTPCGLQCKGLQCHSNMSYMGIEWTFENDMATIRCPYEKKECKLKHEYLQENKVLRYECEVHMAEEEYFYEGSVEHILKLHDDEIRRQEISFGLQRKGRVCREHMRFNRDTLEWEMNYDPYYCGLSRCAGMCPVLGHELDKKRGNVFYPYLQHPYLQIGSLDVMGELAINLTFQSVYQIQIVNDNGYDMAILYLMNYSLSQFVDCLGLWLSFYPQFRDEIARNLVLDPKFSLFEHEEMYNPILNKLKEVDPKSMRQKKFFWRRMCEPDII